MNTTERHERNGAITAARKSGEPTGSIARRFGLTDRQTRRILAEHRADPARELVDDPVAILEATLDAYDEEKAKLAEIASTTRSDAVRLRAVTARVRVLERKTALINSVGLMPPPGAASFDRDSRKLAKEIFAVFDRYEVPREAKKKIVEAITGS